MRVVKVGDRGAAVEDIQRRLLTLGYDLGPTKVDGVFLEGTAEAVRTFQADSSLYADGVVGPRTWSALVDSTFSFGDRMLYLRTPHFHGNDVAELQQALNSLGFACGEEDAIFGTFTERACVEFQQNAGVGADGIVGPNTIAALNGLKHIWAPRRSGAHSQAHGSAVDRARALPALDIQIGAIGVFAEDIARRMVNLAEASSVEACVATVLLADERGDVADQNEFAWAGAHAGADGTGRASGARRGVMVVLVATTSTPADPDVASPEFNGDTPEPIPYLPEKSALAQAVARAIAQSTYGVYNHSPKLVIAIGNESFSKGSKQGVQRAATTILDAVCLALA